jgi:predicted nucleic acid-binding protein
MQAKRSGLLSAIKPVLDDLDNQAGFWLAPALAEAALEKLGEA